MNTWHHRPGQSLTRPCLHRDRISPQKIRSLCFGPGFAAGSGHQLRRGDHNIFFFLITYLILHVFAKELILLLFVHYIIYCYFWSANRGFFLFVLQIQSINYWTHVISYQWFQSSTLSKNYGVLLHGSILLYLMMKIFIQHAISASFKQPLMTEI